VAARLEEIMELVDSKIKPILERIKDNSDTLEKALFDIDAYDK
jgi:hypothetical protein